MHDGLGSSLTTARLLLEQGSVSAREAAEVLRESLDDLRLVFEVSDNDDGDLELALAEFRFRLDQRVLPTGLTTALRLDLTGMPALSGVTLLQLLRVVQEAVSNAVRHARANHLRLSAVWRAQDQTLRVGVHDNGRGIDASSSAGSGRGLANMRLRAESIGAQLVIDSTMAGTRIELQLALSVGSVALKPASPTRLDLSPH
jgi:signal transduction histidine kinase